MFFLDSNPVYQFLSTNRFPGTCGGLRLGEEASSMWGVVRSLGVLRNGEVRLKMEKGEDFREGAEIRPEKSSGDSALSFS